MSGIRSQDWKNLLQKDGLYGAAVPVDGLWYENETGSVPTTAICTSTFSSGCAVERYRRRYSFASWKPSSS